MHQRVEEVVGQLTPIVLVEVNPNAQFKTKIIHTGASVIIRDNLGLMFLLIICVMRCSANSSK